MADIPSSKEFNYIKCIESYKRWLGRKSIEWIGCSQVTWDFDALAVKVNPELGLKINGTNHIIKLYCKADAPSKARIDTILYLIKSTLPRRQRSFTPAVLDVQRGRLFVPTRDIPNIDVLLSGEASAFTTMWNQV